jgi:hypothetical protein
LDLVGPKGYANVDGGCTRVLVVVCVCASHSLGAGNGGVDRFDDGLRTANEGRSGVDGDHVGGAEADGSALDSHACGSARSRPEVDILTLHRDLPILRVVRNIHIGDTARVEGRV